MSDNATTMEDLAAEEARLTDLRERLDAECGKEREARDAMSAAWDGAGDLDALSQTVSAAEVRVSTLRAKIEAQETRVEEVRAGAWRGEAAKRGIGISRAVPSLLKAYHQDDLDRIDAAFDELAETIDRLNRRDAAILTLLIELLFLSYLYPDLDLPKLTPHLPPSKQERAVKVLGKARGLVLNRRGNLPRRLVDLDGRAARRLREQIAGTPTAAILEVADPDWSVESHDARHRQAMRESAERGDAKRRAEIAGVDEWLRDLLANGPIPRDRVIEAAREKGIMLTGGGPMTVAAARQRLDIRTLNPVTEVPAGSRVGSRVRRGVDTSTDFWGLPGAWDPDGFEEYDGRSRLPASAVRR